MAIPAIQVQIEGKRFTLDQVSGGKFYHGTIHNLAVGDTVLPHDHTGVSPNFKESRPGVVSTTSDPLVAYYWAVQAAHNAGLSRDDAIVYEVEPAGAMGVWSGMPAERGKSFQVQELRSERAVVVAKVQV